MNTYEVTLTVTMVFKHKVEGDNSHEAVNWAIEKMGETKPNKFESWEVSNFHTELIKKGIRYEEEKT